MGIKLGADGYGEQTMQAVYVGSVEADAIYVGSTRVYSATSPPSQVTGLAVDSTGDGTIDLSWTAPASEAAISDYSVEYTPSGGSAATVSVGSAATSYQLTGLTNDTEYSVRVAAVSAGGTGAYSAAVTGTPVSGPLITVSGALTGSGTSSDPWRATSFNWKEWPYTANARHPSPTFTANGEVNVQITNPQTDIGREYDGDEFPVHSFAYVNGAQVGGTIVMNGSVDARTVSLNAGDVLSFRWSWDQGSNFKNAMARGLRVYIAPPLEPPTNLRATGCNDGDATIRWDASAAAIRYRVEVNGNNVGTVTDNSFFYGLNGSRQVVIVAIDAAGNEAASSATTLSCSQNG